MLPSYVSLPPPAPSAQTPQEGKVARYNRDHPNFWRSIVVDIAVSALFGIGFFHFISGFTPDARAHIRQTSGVVTLSESELVSEVKRSGALAYWLGPISGSRYSLVVTKNGEVVITYFSGGQGLTDLSRRRFAIETSRTPIVEGPLVSRERQFNNAQDTTAAGLVFAYDKDTPDHVAITLPNGGGHLLIFYPSVRAPSNIQLDAESLIRIS